jgi:hypothetical protein
VNPALFFNEDFIVTLVKGLVSALRPNWGGEVIEAVTERVVRLAIRSFADGTFSLNALRLEILVAVAEADAGQVPSILKGDS